MTKHKAYPNPIDAVSLQQCVKLRKLFVFSIPNTNSFRKYKKSPLNKKLPKGLLD